MIEIINNLYLGDISTVEKYQDYQLSTFSLIINISNISLEDSTKNNLVLTQIFEIKILDIPESNLREHFDITYNLIKKYLQNKQKVLVYCKVGKSRSVSIIINYLMMSQNISYELAFIQMITKKSSVGPNYGFIQQLKDHRYQLHPNPKLLLNNDIEQLQNLHQQKIKILDGKKTPEQWEQLAKDREIERYLDSLRLKDNSIYASSSISSSSQK